MASYKNLKDAISYLERIKDKKELDVDLYAEHDKLYIKVEFYQPNNLALSQLKELSEKFHFLLDEENFSYSEENWNESAMKEKTVFFKMFT